MLSLRSAAAVALAGAALAACGGEPEGGAPLEPVAGVRQRLDLEGSSLFDAPFPIFTRADPSGALDLSGLPNDFGNATLRAIAELLARGRGGFSLNGAIYLPFDGAPGTAGLPRSPSEARDPDANVFLVELSEGPTRGRRVALEVTVKATAETYTPPHLLVALPFQGDVLAPRTRHALVVKRALGDATGAPLGVPLALVQAARGVVPVGEQGPRFLQEFGELFRWADEAGLPRTEIAAATVFTTGDPLEETIALRDDLSRRPPPGLTGFRLVEVFEDYCSVAAELMLPIFQRGEKPYGAPGSGQLVVEGGRLVQQGEDRVGVMLALPRGDPPESGWPLLLYAAGAEGTARQVLDRTRQSEDPDQGLGPPGRGPALVLARRGIASLGFPTVHAWERNATGRSGGLLDFWNVANLGAFRDNLRQAMLDFTSVIGAALAVRLPDDLCPLSPGSRRFDPENLYFYGHSTGSTVGSGVLPLEPALRAGMLSGAGGSWIYNLADADAPFPLRDVVRFLLQLEPDDAVDRFDLPLTLFQTAMEPVEVMSWGRVTTRAPPPGRDARHLLLVGGVVDTYHYPRMINSYALSAALDLVEPAVEPTAAAELALVGRGTTAAPAARNLDGAVTALYLQREAPPGVNGHYVPFEWEDVKARYGCFFASAVRDGFPTLPDAATSELEPCP